MHEPDATSIHLQRAASGDADGIAWVVERFTPLVLVRRAVPAAEDPARSGRGGGPHAGRLGGRPSGARRARPQERAAGLRSSCASSRRPCTDLIGNRLKRRDVVRRPGYARDEGAAERPLDAFATISSGVVTRVARGERRDLVLAAIDELAPADREIVLLRGVEQRDNSRGRRAARARAEHRCRPIPARARAVARAHSRQRVRRDRRRLKPIS